MSKKLASQSQIALLGKLTRSQCFNFDERDKARTFSINATSEEMSNAITKAKLRIQARANLKAAIKDGDIIEITRWFNVCIGREVRDNHILTQADDLIRTAHQKATVRGEK